MATRSTRVVNASPSQEPRVDDATPETTKKTPSDASLIAPRLDFLFRTVRPDVGGGEFTKREVAEGVAAAGGPKVTENYIWMLRAGRRSNPSTELLNALAAFFGVDHRYFTDDDIAAEVDDQLELFAAIRVPQVADLTVRIAQLEPARLNLLAGMVELLHQDQAQELQKREAGLARRRRTRATPPN